jgi:hypothetical protein
MRKHAPKCVTNNRLLLLLGYLAGTFKSCKRAADCGGTTTVAGRLRKQTPAVADTPGDADMKNATEAEMLELVYEHEEIIAGLLVEDDILRRIRALEQKLDRVIAALS